MRLQRAGDDGNPAEMQRDKWTVEGEEKGFSEYLRRDAGVSGRKCVGIFVREA